MVTVLLRGGLGNQMFQYAAGLNLALKNDTKLILDTTYLNDRFPRRAFTIRNYDLDIFNINPSFTSLSKVSKKFPVPGFWLAADLAALKVGAMAGRGKFLTENNADDFFIDPTEDNLALWGFWHKEKYFIDNEYAVRDAFRFRWPLAGEAADLAVAIKSGNSIALHVRRGDYTLPKYAEVYGGTDLAYYFRAVTYLGKWVGNPKFFVFSDDIAWCRENIVIPFPTTYIDDSSSGPKSSFHLHLMSLCKHNVIANSTFSWWAAWLNENPGKIVIAPERWSKDERSRDGIVPAAWLTM